MNDTLHYMQLDPVHRKYHHHQMTFSMVYAYSENFVLPLSHDEVVHGKGSILGRMPGDDWQKFANLRAYYGFMWGHPGKKLLFMGNEFAQRREWNHDVSLDWHLLDDESGYHAGVQRLVSDDHENSVFAFLRRDNAGNEMLVVSNFTPVPRQGYRIGVPHGGRWHEVLNTDSAYYNGSNSGNQGEIHSEPIPWHYHGYSLSLTLPPLATLFLLREGE